MVDASTCMEWLNVTSMAPDTQTRLVMANVT